MGRRMRVTSAPICILLLIYTSVYAFIPGVDGPVSHQEALEGGNTTLYCDTTPDSLDDEFMILVWYKNNLPIYSFETPDKAWTDESFNTNDRIKADLHSQPTAVIVTALTEEDQALYHCRVDFRLSPTRNIGVNLTVVVLPSPPFFMDEVNNKVVDKVGPYHDGDTLVLRCLVIGGHPPPRISWYSGENLVDASDSDSDIPNVRENELYLPLTRENAAALSCRASNTHLTPPIIATLEIELYLPAYNVEIYWVQGTIGDTLQAGKPAVVKCIARGSYPQPEVSWWLGRKHLTQHSNQSWSNESHTAVSFLELTPAVGDNGVTLACVATNPVMAPSRGSKADVIPLNVTYSPIIEVTKLGDGKLNEVVELDSLHLECEVRANPPVERFMWYFNFIPPRPLYFWSSAGSLMNQLSPKSMVLTRSAHKRMIEATTEVRTEEVPRTTAVETNDDSRNLRTHPPECIGHGIRLVKETINCNVKALPIPDTFFWHLQPSGFDVQHLTTGSPFLPLDQITGPLAGSLKATCEASNGIASQEEPCERTFTFEHLRPQQPQKCDLAFEYGEFQMRCIPVENATYYEVSVWRMSTTNTSLVLDKRGSMGFGTGQALAQSGGTWLVRGALGTLKAGDEAGALACNRYGCSRALLLRPTENLLEAASPPWWNFILEKHVGISIGAVVLVILFAITTALMVRLVRRARAKTTAPVIQVLQLDDVAMNYLDNIGEHKIRASNSLRSCSSGFSIASGDSAPTIDRRRKPAFWDRWDAPPPDVTLTLHRESAV
ncbi:hypothetical protein K1T71_010904 [Dendrolimus kikuchii]|uniref:Uncharacterized protein n=1 Tax=Dendrolimus kikuchii TaxID=765133 RepID=A0ACC1CQG5_9NEOP|nr:hypothetical protein K1T71_010904 [Dendrolimus kikuchii]